MLTNELTAEKAKEISLENSSVKEITADEARLKSIRASLRGVFNAIRDRADHGERYLEFDEGRLWESPIEKAEALSYLKSLGYKVKTFCSCLWDSDISAYIQVVPTYSNPDFQKPEVLDETIVVDGKEYHLAAWRGIRIEW